MNKLVYSLLLTALLLSFPGCSAVRSDSPVSVTFFRCGKADAAVIQSDGAVILIDTGLKKNADKLADALRELGVEKISVLILSHFDKDHVGGAAEILASFPVETVYHSNYPKDSDEYASYLNTLQNAGIEPVTVTDTVNLDLGGIGLAINGPVQEVYKNDPSNNSSLIVSVTHGTTSLLFTGDAQNARLSEYLAQYERPAGTVILKVPYHGHWQKTLPDFLAAVSPDIAVIPCSKSEPEEEELSRTVSLLEALGAQVLLTSDGDVTLTIN